MSSRSIMRAGLVNTAKIIIIVTFFEHSKKQKLSHPPEGKEQRAQACDT